MPDGSRARGKAKNDVTKRLSEELPEVLRALEEAQGERGFFSDNEEANAVLETVVGAERADAVRLQLVNAYILIVDGQHNRVIYLDAAHGRRVCDAIRQGREPPVPGNLRRRLEEARARALEHLSHGDREGRAEPPTLAVPYSSVVGYRTMETTLRLLRSEFGYPDTRELPPVVVRRIAKLVHPNSEDTGFILWDWCRKKIVIVRKTKEQRPRYAAFHVPVVKPEVRSDKRPESIVEPDEAAVRAMLLTLATKSDERIAAEFAEVGAGVPKPRAQEETETAGRDNALAASASERSAEEQALAEAEGKLHAVEEEIHELFASRKKLRARMHDCRQRILRRTLMQQEIAAARLADERRVRAETLEAEAARKRELAEEERQGVRAAVEERERLRQQIEAIERELGIASVPVDV